jgi:hypothetical protein
VGSVPAIATYLVLRKPEFGAMEPLAFGNILLRTMDRLLADRLVGPGFLFSSWRLFAPGAVAGRQRYAAYCRDVAEAYRDNWLVRVSEEGRQGDGRRHFEIRVTRCALYNYLKTLQASEITPYFCAIDCLAFARLGLGFQRTTVLCQGGDCCDFRCSQGEAAPSLPLPLKELPADCRRPGHTASNG